MFYPSFLICRCKFVSAEKTNFESAARGDDVGAHRNMPPRRGYAIISSVLTLLLSISTASAQNFGSPADQFQPSSPAPSSGDSLAADLLEALLIVGPFIFEMDSDGSGSSQSGPDNTYQHRLNQYGGSSSETPPEPDNSTGLYGTCHNPMGC